LFIFGFFFHKSFIISGKSDLFYTGPDLSLVFPLFLWYSSLNSTSKFQGFALFSARAGVPRAWAPKPDTILTAHLWSTYPLSSASPVHPGGALEPFSHGSTPQQQLRRTAATPYKNLFW
jgi:hypothetical protein